MSKAQSNNPVEYKVVRAEVPCDANDDAIIQMALAILTARCTDVHRNLMDSPQAVKDYLVLRAGQELDQYVERFGVMFLDSQNRLIKTVTLFTGTLTQTSVYPREIVRAALAENASAVVFTHNHPSGDPHPSRADENLTQVLKSALSLIDVRVLDHIITAGGKSLSMAEKGLI